MLNSSLFSGAGNCLHQKTSHCSERAYKDNKKNKKTTVRVHLWPCFSCTYMMSHRLTCLVCACSGTLCIEGHVLARQHMRRLKEAMLGRATGDCVCVCARQSERETVSRGPCVIYCSPQIKQPGIHTPRQLQTHLKSLKKVLKIKHSFRHTFPLFYTILFPVLCA